MSVVLEVHYFLKKKGDSSIAASPHTSILNV